MPFRSRGPVRYWRPGLREAVRHRFMRNPGDELGPTIVSAVLAQKHSALEAWSRSGRRLLTVGSVVQLARPGDVVWGAGLRSAELANVLSHDIDVRAVRGPLTADAIKARLGIDCRVFGDPGLLVPELLGLPRRDRARLQTLPRDPQVLFLSHFADPRVPPRRMRHLRMIGKPGRILAAIQASDVVLSSALHGIVLAEALGVPTVWVAGLDREPPFKFLDYFHGTQRNNPRSITSFMGWESAINVEPRFSASDLLEAFPLDCFSQRPFTNPWQRLKAGAQDSLGITP
ncbi:MAG: polysaccharide pyruvyl transferase family protein [Polyangiales bacterium]